ncbi:DUF1835 domain-containing protein [Lutibacter sp. TH_r2]|uniref:DUF1835 domain-containing protein n=1 Tax=Lutibacter sp. TH_r2 TaxID=3082083 RepID=UPI002954EDA0|nr:DUF1835 domain-containing protein [Lutibacter sp. TH_r2]MDV7186260.1 DUF1835 domain-containing protein [Lutibacter sp. TH_r2]
MDNILHVVNGDSTAKILKESNIQGDILVWHEMLCEGPLDKEVGSDTFWMNRYNFFKNEFNVERLEYFDKTIKKIVQLEDLEGVNEVVLWFEYDLFCQINLLATCSYLLKNYRKDVTYSLVCVGYEKGKDKLQTLSDYTSEEYPKLLENKIKITKANLEFTDKCWEVYVKNNKEELQNYKFKNPKFWYLPKAIEQHLKRFPLENGLNEIQNKILQIIQANSFSEKEIVRELLLWQNAETVYGFGDLQYFNYLKKLSDYYQVKDEIYSLNKLGKSKI